jgi:hypothetical protein
MFGIGRVTNFSPLAAVPSPNLIDPIANNTKATLAVTPINNELTTSFLGATDSVTSIASATVTNEVPITSGKINANLLYDYAIVIQRMRQNIKQGGKAVAMKKIRVDDRIANSNDQQSLITRLQRAEDRLRQMLSGLMQEFQQTDDAQVLQAITAKITAVTEQLQRLSEAKSAVAAKQSAPARLPANAPSRPQDIDINDPVAVLRLRQQVFGFDFGALRV